MLTAGGSAAAPDEPADPDESVAPLPDLETILRAAVEATAQEDDWAHLGSIGNHLAKRHASFDPRNYGFPKLISLVRAQTYLDVEQAGGNVTRVRLRPAAPGQSAQPAQPAAKRASGRRRS